MDKKIIREIIDEINLPKQILDKTSNFLSQLCGPSINEVGQLFADKIRYRRMANQIKVFAKTMELLESNNLEPKNIKLKTLIPFIEECSLEEDEEIQQKWANLLANISTSKEENFDRKAISLLGSLISSEAIILDHCYKLFMVRVDSHTKNSLFPNSKVEPLSMVNELPFMYSRIRESLKVAKKTYRISMDNLVNYGLFNWGEPNVSIEADHETRVEVQKDKKTKELYVDVDLDYSADVNRSNYVYLTSFGIYFVEMCSFEKGKKENKI